MNWFEIGIFKKKTQSNKEFMFMGTITNLLFMSYLIILSSNLNVSEPYYD